MPRSRTTKPAAKNKASCRPLGGCCCCCCCRCCCCASSASSSERRVVPTSWTSSCLRSSRPLSICSRRHRLPPACQPQRLALLPLCALGLLVSGLPQHEQRIKHRMGCSG